MPFVNPASLDSRGFCAGCQAGLVGFDASYSYGNYEGTLRQLIHLFKYGKVESLSEPLARFLAAAIPLEVRFDMIIAMPMHWRKEWDRGFHQAELLARPIAQRYGLKLSRNLRRTRHTKAQAGLNEAGRRNNLKNSFGVNRPQQLLGKRVLLIDDVLTTGATLRVAAETLKAAGAAHVTCLTLARVDTRSPARSSASLSALQRSVLASEQPAESFAFSREDGSTEVSAGTGERRR